MSNDEPTFSAPDDSWPGPVMPDERDDAQNADTTQVTNGVQTARATEMFVPPSQAGGLVGVEHEDSEYDDDVATPRIVLPALMTDVDMSAPIGEDKPLPKGRFADREISWMAFNQRVLEQSEDPTLPLLERAWFTAIFSSNLDEFYMVRVAGLKRRIAAGIAKKGASELEPRQVLEGIQARTQELTARQARAFQDDILPALAEQGIRLARWDDVSEDQRAQLTRYFRRQIFPVLTPLAVDPSHPFPYISGLSLNLAVVVRNPLTGKLHFARVKVPQSLPRLINVDSVIGGGPAESYVATDEGTTFITLEDVVRAHLEHLFPGVEIVEAHGFRVTRNEDLEVEEDDAENLLTAMEEELLRRKFGPVVRLEVEDTISSFVRDFLIEKLEISPADVVSVPAPLDLTLCNELHDLDLTDLKYAKYVPVTAAGLAEFESARAGDIFAQIRSHDVLLHHPYDSFATSVQAFITQAARDPNVLAMKQTLYRTSGDSPIVSAMIEAAQSGKQVVAIVEIKARFDEEANIGWARKLERAGVHVVYGMVGLKTHCKLSLVVRQEADGLRRYCHVGTGNYHPKTARGYEDLGLLTCDREVAQDLTRLFNQLSGYAPRSTFHRLLVAPLSIRDGLIERINAQIARKKAGGEAWIGIKVNSVVDEAVIDALYRASQAGVKVDVQVRGICAIRAGVPGLSENIRVRSILGRYLEHSRIYAFGVPGEEEVWIGSADLMHRNLDRRVEALVRMSDPDQVEYLANLIRRGVSSKTSSWVLKKSGNWKRHQVNKDGSPLVDLQVELMEAASSRVIGR
ncbi:RNA degradosome polyphosphate kinase [Actinomycetaceae bacterium UMB8039B]|uniref:RNA degradosome polyphosphate kinase n=1 Tax=Pauljensenia sp. UMB8040A TaxID=3046343 RepID=UPI00254B008C|nr:RNA degradosome polyphosphate kinase [Pauljensenia sp. UMB8040A]MDK7780549.1 RNA degradosome polyphosphate kinase [Actinomycetaceae bacterium UMB8041B]MDK8293012.1 RNA degradosome polyphosphate kinase [Actinomycetaceae bacterium UMB8039B]MDK8299683.1 RNA degradosome polyphosphate kinase [Actinomycetaceae bacterium UMB1218B]MDK8607909.1 RNA degradosome polyphosphate kinase [Actinomycetaceae bacterium UMB8041A]MDK8752406.1 RNA degradosome polyphosphate kinase [Actinomycetaceae bacterium UMB80